LRSSKGPAKCSNEESRCAVVKAIGVVVFKLFIITIIFIIIIIIIITIIIVAVIIIYIIIILYDIILIILYDIILIFENMNQASCLPTEELLLAAVQFLQLNALMDQSEIVWFLLFIYLL
jgi:hypothetical protein